MSQLDSRWPGLPGRATAANLLPMGSKQRPVDSDPTLIRLVRTGGGLDFGDRFKDFVG